ncbi:hypothetical protein UZ36_05585 [Candidatus Nitromaritima sp. SCGC AAA799-C22]|nr:hypothetical protein UZ36_05585 [Candidatus Nitromaritima sp. SCGC AAA799-C22]
MAIGLQGTLGSDTAGISGSSQGANRTKVINEASNVQRDPIQVRDVSSRELGGDRSPNSIVQTGGKEVNTGQSTQITAPPEIGKGSIADLFI